MSKVIPKEIREKIIIHKENGVPEETIAKWLLISKRSVTRISARYRKTGSIEALPQNIGRNGVQAPMVFSGTLKEGVIEPILACGATVKYLPPYSTDFNPIELMWSKKVKAILKN